MNSFKLEILTPEKAFYEGEAIEMIVPLTDGMFGIRAHHENLMGATVDGPIKIKLDKDHVINAKATKGLLKVMDNRVLLMVDYIFNEEDFDSEKEKMDNERRKEEEKYKESLKDYYMAEAEFKKALNRVRTGR